MKHAAAYPDAWESGRERTSILFVCAANVCRSPAMEFLTRHHLGELGASSPWRFVSAGTKAVAGEAMCPQSAEVLLDLPFGTTFAGDHRSRRLTPELVASAGLILAASQEERAVIARISPAARSRSFTMAEAAMLAELALARPSLESTAPLSTLEGLAEVLNASRALLVHEGRQSFLRRRRGEAQRPQTIDISDVHTGDSRRHGPLLRELRWTGQHLAHGLVGLGLGSRGREPAPADEWW